MPAPTQNRCFITVILIVTTLMAGRALAEEPCQRVHGRARLYTGDGQLSIWHIGTHHTFSFGTDDGSWEMLLPYVGEHGENSLYADFTVCPYGPYVKGAAQNSKLTRIEHPRVVRWSKND